MLLVYNQGMRTTLTLEDDVAQALRQRAKETNRSFKAVVNEVMRAGLAAEEMSRSADYGVDEPERFEDMEILVGRVRVTKEGIPIFPGGGLKPEYEGMLPSEVLATIQEEEDRERVRKMEEQSREYELKKTKDEK